MTKVLFIRAEWDDEAAVWVATSDDVPKLRFTDWCVRESMPLYPPAWAIGRNSFTAGT